MPTKFHVKRGDEVVVIAGAEKGKRGKIIQVVPKKERVIVEGINIIKNTLNAINNILKERFLSARLQFIFQM